MTVIALLKFTGLFTFSHGGSNGVGGGGVLLMWCVPLCSGLVALSCGWRNFEEILQHLRFFSLLTCLFVCVKFAEVGLNACERQRAILEDGCHHSCLAKVL